MFFRSHHSPSESFVTDILNRRYAIITTASNLLTNCFAVSNRLLLFCPISPRNTFCFQFWERSEFDVKLGTLEVIEFGQTLFFKWKCELFVWTCLLLYIFMFIWEALMLQNFWYINIKLYLICIRVYTTLKFRFIYKLKKIHKQTVTTITTVSLENTMFKVKCIFNNGTTFAIRVKLFYLRVNNTHFWTVPPPFLRIKLYCIVF